MFFGDGRSGQGLNGRAKPSKPILSASSLIAPANWRFNLMGKAPIDF
jgi:hypothetical protein